MSDKPVGFITFDPNVLVICDWCGDFVTKGATFRRDADGHDVPVDQDRLCKPCRRLKRQAEYIIEELRK